MLISKPYMERRAYATARRVWPEVDAVCASERLSLDDYVKSIGDDRLVCAVHQPNFFPQLSILAKLNAADVWGTRPGLPCPSRPRPLTTHCTTRGKTDASPRPSALSSKGAL
jgi:hypothetical protein